VLDVLLGEEKKTRRKFVDKHDDDDHDHDSSLAPYRTMHDFVGTKFPVALHLQKEDDDA